MLWQPHVHLFAILLELRRGPAAIAQIVADPQVAEPPRAVLQTRSRGVALIVSREGALARLKHLVRQAAGDRTIDVCPRQRVAQPAAQADALQLLHIQSE